MSQVLMSRKGYLSRKAAFVERQSETAQTADLGGSSKYSNENFED